MPLRTHSFMTSQMSSSPSRTSASVRHDSSFSSMIREIDLPVSLQCASSSSPVRKGWATGVESSTIFVSPTAFSPTTKPPPTE